MASQRIYGSMNLTKLLAAAKAKHSAFVKGKKTGDIYFNFTQWLNEEPDQNGDDCSFQLSSTKAARESGTEKKATYFGNGKIAGKEHVKEETAEIAAGDDLGVADDLPF